MKAQHFFIILICLPLRESKYFFRFTKLDCSSSFKTATKVSCFLKAHVRSNPLMNVRYTLLRSVPDTMVSLMLLEQITWRLKVFIFQLYLRISRKSSLNQYQLIVTIPDIHYCKILEGMSTSPFLVSVLDAFKSFGDCVEICTRAGEFQASNISFSDLKFISIWPAGYYKVNLVLFDDTDSSILNATYFAILTN